MENRLELFRQTKLDPTTTWLLFLFLGWGYGSFKQYNAQLLYYLTLGGFGIWFLYCLLTLNEDISEHNYNAAVKCGLSDDEMQTLGLVQVKIAPKPEPKQPKNIDLTPYLKWVIVAIVVMIVFNWLIFTLYS